jgi:thiol-disulfide isomerase/thioredoxin
MNRRTLIIVTAVVAVGLFAIGGLLYSPTSKEVAVTKPVSNEAPLVRPHSPVFGAKDAPVTIVEFFDPACEACRAFHPVVKKILSEFQGKVRVVLRYTAFHPPSEEAIRILEAARLQGKFEVVLERLLETQPRWAPHGRPADSAWSLLDGTGLDVERARRDAKDYAMDHTSSVFLFDASGQFRNTIDFHENREIAVPKIRRVLRDR